MGCRIELGGAGHRYRALGSPGDGFYYLVRAENSCATGGLGPGREALDPLDCMSP